MGLDLVELVMEAEKTFGISIPDEAAEQMRTPRKMADYLASQLVGPASLSEHGAEWSREKIEAMVRQLVHDELGVKNFSMDDDFVRDMGAD